MDADLSSSLPRDAARTNREASNTIKITKGTHEVKECFLIDKSRTTKSKMPRINASHFAKYSNNDQPHPKERSSKRLKVRRRRQSLSAGKLALPAIYCAKAPKPSQKPLIRRRIHTTILSRKCRNLRLLRLLSSDQVTQHTPQIRLCQLDFLPTLSAHFQRVHHQPNLRLAL